MLFLVTNNYYIIIIAAKFFIGFIIIIIIIFRYGGGSFSFSRLIRTLTKSFATEWELHEVEMFFEEHPDAGSAALAVEQSKETIRGNIHWVNEDLEVVNNWIDQNIP